MTKKQLAKLTLRTYMVVTNRFTWGKGATINEALNNARINFDTEAHIAVIDHEPNSTVYFIEAGMSPAFTVTKDDAEKKNISDMENAEYDFKWMPGTNDPRVDDVKKPTGLCIRELNCMKMETYDLVGFMEERLKERYSNIPQHILVKLDTVHNQLIDWCEAEDVRKEEAAEKAQVKA